MSSKRYTDEYKTEAVKQVLERGYSTRNVAERLGLNKHSLYAWVKRAKVAAEAGQEIATVAAERAEAKEIRHLRAELKRVTEERDILKKAAAYFARGKGEVRVHA